MITQLGQRKLHQVPGTRAMGRSVNGKPADSKSATGSSNLSRPACADIVQLVERNLGKVEVVGPIPTVRSEGTRWLSGEESMINCLYDGCNREAVSGSNYCRQHLPSFPQRYRHDHLSSVSGLGWITLFVLLVVGGVIYTSTPQFQARWTYWEAQHDASYDSAYNTELQLLRSQDK